jgi:hypothetical protein
MGPLNTLMELFEGPAILVQKRHDKLLDYDSFLTKAEKNKDNRMVSDFNKVLAHKHLFICTISQQIHCSDSLLILNLLMSYIYGAPSKARNLTSYIWTRFFTGDFSS